MYSMAPINRVRVPQDVYIPESVSVVYSDVIRVNVVHYIAVDGVFK